MNLNQTSRSRPASQILNRPDFLDGHEDDFRSLVGFSSRDRHVKARHSHARSRPRRSEWSGESAWT